MDRKKINGQKERKKVRKTCIKIKIYKKTERQIDRKKERQIERKKERKTD